MKTVVFDIDGTLTDEVGFMRKHAPTFLEKVYGFHVSEMNKNAYGLADMYDLKTVLLAEGYLEEEAEVRARKISQEFWNRYFVKYCAEPVREGAKETVAALKEMGYEIHIVSMRGKITKKEERLKDRIIRKKIVPLLTKWQLWKAGIRADHMELPVSIEKKLEYVQALNPEYYFEDQCELINSAAQVISKTSKVVCVSTDYNAKFEFAENVMRIKCFRDESLKSELCEGAKLDSKTAKHKREANIFYRVAKVLGGPFVYAIYRPIIFGKRNIPKNRSIAFVGNHRSKSDPIIMIAIAKQMIHWAALQRMFNGGEDLFSSTKSRFRCNFSARLLRWMGAVPIARPEDADYQNINLQTIKFLTLQLKEKQDSIGFFPEGTLNRNPEKENVLPLKSSRVFKIATMTKCYLQPFSIVWIPKNKVIKNRVIVMFSYPINCENRSVDELSEMWKATVEENIQIANEFITSMDVISFGIGTRKEKQRKIREEIKNFKNILSCDLNW